MAKDLIINNGKLETLKPVGAPNVRQINYILNADAEVNTTGWATYAESNSVTFQDSGDTVTLNSHGLLTGTPVVFSSITSTTGISINTTYYVVNPLTNTFQVASSVGGSALPLTTNGSGTMVRPVPVTGSGGTAQTDLWIRSTTSPLRGSASFRLDKTGSLSRQGQGVAYDFTIDKADQAKVLSISFDYEVLSANGTYADGDVTVYVYDVTNSVLIQPAGYVLQNVSLGTENKHIATFQTASNSTSYRLILHVSSASTQNYTLAIDNVTVGPQTVQYGAPITDWQSFTPTGGFTQNAVYSGRWRRVGSNMEIYARVDFTGATNGSPAICTFNISSIGYSIDLSKCPVNIGTGYARDNGVAVFPLEVTASDQTSFTPVYNVTFSTPGGTSIGHNSITNNNLMTISNGDFIDVRVSVPIVGWSSTVQMSSDTDTRVVVANGEFTGSTGATLLTITNSTLPLTVKKDTHSSVSSNVFRVPVSGYYQYQANIVGASSTAMGQTITFGLALNGNLSYSVGSSWEAHANRRDATVAGCEYFNAGDLLSFRGYTDASTFITLGEVYNRWSIQRVSGPSSVAASETVAFNYRLGTPYAYTKDAAMYCDTKIFDTHNSFTVGTTSGGSFYRIPVSGIYKIKMSGDISTVAGPTAVGLFKNDVQYSETGWLADSGFYEWLVQCVAGDRILVQINGYSGTLGSVYTSFSGYRVG